MSTWAPSLSPRRPFESRVGGINKVLATAADFREELAMFAKGPLSDVIQQKTREQLEGFLTGSLREELRSMEERLRGAVVDTPPRAGVPSHPGAYPEAGRLMSYSPLPTRRSAMVEDPSLGAARGGVSFIRAGGGQRQSMHGNVPQVKPGLKPGISAMVKQIAQRRRQSASVLGTGFSGLMGSSVSRSSDNPPSYSGMPMIPDDEEEAAEGQLIDWQNSEGFYDEEAEARQREAKEEEERISKMSAMRGQHHAQRSFIAVRTEDDGEETLLPPPLPPPKLSMKWVKLEFVPWLAAVILSPAFEYLSCAAVLINTALLGVETDHLARNIYDPQPFVFNVADTVLCLFFLLELVARIGVFGKDFFCGDSAMLNIFDTFLVSFQVADEIISIVHMHTNAGVMIVRNLRIVRFVRIFRLTRVLALVGELRTLLVSIASSMKSLVWVIIILGVLTYSFGIFLTHVVISKRQEHSRQGDVSWEGEEELLRWYGSVTKSMLSLFESVSEGVHWSEAMDPLTEFVSPWLMLAFLGYIIFAIFALLNVVTGLFVEAAIATAQEDKKVMLCQQMCQMFVDCDADNSGTVSWDEWNHHLENPEMEMYLKELDIDKHEAPLLFHLLDFDGSGEIEAEELVGGCLRLHGAAKALELAALIHEFRGFSKQWVMHANRIEEALNLSPISRVSTGRRLSSVAAGLPGYGRMTTTMKDVTSFSTQKAAKNSAERDRFSRLPPVASDDGLGSE